MSEIIGTSEDSNGTVEVEVRLDDDTVRIVNVIALDEDVVAAEMSLDEYTELLDTIEPVFEGEVGSVEPPTFDGFEFGQIPPGLLVFKNENGHAAMLPEELLESRP